MNFQDLINKLNKYWSRLGLIIGQPYGVEVGAGTANPHTFFRVLGPEPFFVAYVEPSRRPADGRYGENPNRLQHYYQYQIILKPAPANHLELYLNMLKYIGINPLEHDIRFVEDNWASPSLRAWGLGWEVWLDSMEITQYTYFQQMGGLDISEPVVEITLGLERLSMYVQKVDDYRLIKWNDFVTYGDLFSQHEFMQSKYNFEEASVKRLQNLIDIYFAEAENLIKRENFWAAYDYILKVSHAFNILDARGVTSAEYRRELFNKIGGYLNKIAFLYQQSRKKMNYPLLNKGWHLSNKNGEDVKEVLNSILSENFDMKHNNLMKYNSILSEINNKTTKIVEFGFEELPHEVILELSKREDKIVRVLLEEFGVVVSDFSTILTPRRVGFVLKNLTLKEEHVVKKGPPLRVVKNSDGTYNEIYRNLTNKYNGILIDTYEEDGYLYFKLRNTFDLAEFATQFLNRLFDNLHFKFMNYRKKQVVRPLRTVLLIDGAKLFTSIDNLNKLKFNQDVKIGYRLLPVFLGGGVKKCSNISEYADTTQKWGLILNISDRKNYIFDRIVARINKLEHKLHFEKAGRFEEQILLNTALTESPAIYIETLQEKYQTLPFFLIEDILWQNQKYIVISPENYVIVSNNPVRSLSFQAVKRGARKVAIARLEDGLFYYKRDKNMSLSELIKEADNIMYGQRTLKKIKKDVRNVIKLLLQMVNSDENDDVDENLIKKFLQLWRSDLLTNMGREFPHLVGKILASYLGNKHLKVDINNVSADELEKLIYMFNNSNELEHLESRHIKEYSKELLLIFFSIYLVELLWNVHSHGIPKGSTDKYSLKSKADMLIVLFKELSFRNIHFDLVELLNRFIQIADFTFNNEEFAVFVDFIKRRLVRQLHYDWGLNLNVISSVIYTPGLFYPDNKLRKLLTEQFIEKVKRIYNLVKNDIKKEVRIQALFYMSRFEWRAYLARFFTNLKKKMNACSMLIDDDSKLFKIIENLQELNNTKNNDTYALGRYLDDIVLYIDKVKIYVDSKKLSSLRLDMIKYLVYTILKNINIPYLLNQDV